MIDTSYQKKNEFKFDMQWNSIILNFHLSYVNYFLIQQLKESNNDNGFVLHHYIWSIAAQKS